MSSKYKFIEESSKQTTKTFASLGRVQTLVSAIIGTIIGIIIFGIGIFLTLQKDNLDSVTSGIITMADCISTQSVSKGHITLSYICNIDVKYKVGDQEYTNKFKVSKPNPLVENTPIDISYNSKNPNESAIKQIKSKYLGIGSIISGLLLVGIVWLVFVLAMKNKYFSAIQGANSLRIKL